MIFIGPLVCFCYRLVRKKSSYTQYESAGRDLEEGLFFMKKIFKRPLVTLLYSFCWNCFLVITYLGGIKNLPTLSVKSAGRKCEAAYILQER